MIVSHSPTRPEYCVVAHQRINGYKMYQRHIHGYSEDSTWTFISLSVSQILMTRTSPDVMRRPVSCSQSTTIPAPTAQNHRQQLKHTSVHTIISAQTSALMSVDSRETEQKVAGYHNKNFKRLLMCLISDRKH